MSDSDSSSDESSGDGIEIMISNLESSDYDGHLKIIAKCKKEGELDFLRNGLLVNQASSLPGLLGRFYFITNYGRSNVSVRRGIFHPPEMVFAQKTVLWLWYCEFSLETYDMILYKTVKKTDKIKIR